MTAYLTNHDPTSIGFHAGIFFRLGFAQCKNVPEHFHLNLTETLPSNGTSTTTATLGVSSAEIGSSNETFASALTAAEEHSAASRVTCGALHNGELVKAGSGRNMTATSGETRR